MTLYVTEHSNVQRLAAMGFPLNLSPVASYGLTSASASPAPQAASQFVRVNADAGMLFAISSSSTPTLTSTNAFRIGANQPAEFFAIPASTLPRFICAQST